MLNAISLSTFLFSSVLMLVCFSTKNKERYRIYLAVFFACMALQAGFILLSTTTIYSVYPFLLYVGLISGILASSVIYLFVLSVMNNVAARSTYINLSILPVLGTVIFFTFYYLTNGFSVERWYVFECFILMSALTLCSYIVITVYSLRIINPVLLNSEELSKRDRVILIWVKYLLWFLIFRAFISFASLGIQVSYKDTIWISQIMLSMKYVFSIFLLLMVLLTSYYVLRNPEFFNTISEQPSLAQSIAISILPAKQKAEMKKVLPEEEVRRYLEKIEKTVLEQKLFLDQKLTQKKLSEQTGIPVYKISLTLNKEAGKNFHDYINYHRVEFAKTLLAEPERSRDTIYAIAIDSGFASEAPFYSAFKKYSGQSPSAYRASVLKG